MAVGLDSLWPAWLTGWLTACLPGMFAQVGPVPVALRSAGPIGCVCLAVTHVQTACLINYLPAGVKISPTVRVAFPSVRCSLFFFFDFADNRDINSQWNISASLCD